MAMTSLSRYATLATASLASTVIVDRSSSVTAPPMGFAPSGNRRATPIATREAPEIPPWRRLVMAVPTALAVVWVAASGDGVGCEHPSGVRRHRDIDVEGAGEAWEGAVEAPH